MDPPDGQSVRICDLPSMLTTPAGEQGTGCPAHGEKDQRPWTPLTTTHARYVTRLRRLTPHSAPVLPESLCTLTAV